MHCMIPPQTGTATGEYKSRAYLCKTCPTRGMCTESAKCEKTFLRHIWQEYVEMAEDIRHMAVYRELYRLRKEKIERVFADAKEKHGNALHAVQRLGPGNELGEA